MKPLLIAASFFLCFTDVIVSSERDKNDRHNEQHFDSGNIFAINSGFPT